MVLTHVITGASSGIGFDLCEQLIARGDRVYATVRARGSSASNVDVISVLEGSSEGRLVVVEGINVANDDVGELLKEKLKGVDIDGFLIHNAGSLHGARLEVDGGPGSHFAQQKLDAISMDRMREAFEVNTLGPLRVQQALHSQLKDNSAKVAIITTGFASIGDNTSGGVYAYRTSKAAANMVAKNFSVDLKARGIFACAISPGFVVTEFGPGKEAMEKMGAKPVAQAGRGIIEVLDNLTAETTGCFMVIPSSGEKPKEMPW